MAWGKGRVPVGFNNSSDPNFGKSEQIGGALNQELRVLIGATHSSTNRIGYCAESKVDGHNYLYSIAGNDVVNNVTSTNINHSTLVLRDNGMKPNTLQPFIVCYMWKRTA